MKKFITILFLLVAGIVSLNAQKEDYVWYFGDSILLDFNSLPPTANNNANLGSYEASASICDKSGNLLFYACDSAVYNRSFSPMANGRNLQGSFSATQGCLIIPQPENDKKYFLFQISLLSNSPLNFGLKYSIIDMELDNGMGGVTGEKNELLYQCNTGISERMIGIKHSNGNDWWLILHEMNNNRFVRFLITNSGIEGPFFSNTGQNYPTDGSQVGEMEASLAGNKICVSTYSRIIDLFDFDRCSGELIEWRIIKNHFPITHLPGFYYGCSFSSDGNVLYVSQGDTSQYFMEGFLYQFDLTAADIPSSETLIWQGDTSESLFGFIGQLQLGPDGRIYLSSQHGLNPIVNNYLGVIENPEIIGLGCNFSPHSLYVGPSLTQLNLPNLPNYRLGPIYYQPANAGPDQQTRLCETTTIGVADTSGNRCTFSWFPSTGLSNAQTAQPTVNLDGTGVSDSITYILTVTDTSAHSDCATTQDTVTVYVKPCEMKYPNVFTPNGDGINDFFFIKNLAPGTAVSIYDRWGERVFFSENYGQEFGGIVRGVALPEGVYYYVVRPPHPDQKEVAGWVAILR